MKNLDLKYLETFIYSSNDLIYPNNKIIFIHGFYTDHRCFEPVYEKLKKYCECICFNLPGCGSEKIKQYPLNYLRIENHAKLIAKYIIENNLDNIYLIGHSLGAAISAMVINILKNKRIKKVAFLAPFNITSIPMIIDKPSKFNKFKNEKDYNLFQKIIFEDYNKAIMHFSEQRYYDGIFDFQKRNHKYSGFIMLNFVRIWTLAYLHMSYKSNKVPSLLMVSSKDQFVAMKNTIDYFKKTTKHLQVIEYFDVGHAFFIEEFDLFYKDIFTWLFNKKDKVHNLEKYDLDEYDDNEIINSNNFMVFNNKNQEYAMKLFENENIFNLYHITNDQIDQFKNELKNEYEIVDNNLNNDMNAFNTSLDVEFNQNKYDDDSLKEKNKK